MDEGLDHYVEQIKQISGRTAECFERDVKECLITLLTDFLKELINYARNCKALDYDGIGKYDIIGCLVDFLKGS